MNNFSFDKNLFLKSIIDNLPCQLLIIDKDMRICYVNSTLLEETGHSRIDLMGVNIQSIWPEHTLPKLLNANSGTRLMYRDIDNFYVQGGVWHENDLLGAMQLSFPAGAYQLPENNTWGGSYYDLNNDIWAIFNSSYDVIYATDGQGITQKVSSACEDLWGLTADKLIGRRVQDLEEEGVFRPSIARIVLETKQRVQCIQVTKTGRKLMVIGTPFTNKDGEIVQVINLSRDITSETSMKVELDSIKLLLDAYKHELNELRSRNMEQNKFIYTSRAMANVAHMALKVSEVDSTVMITGESGVGKEILASFIHANSLRKDKQFIKINCSAIPETLLESELFGYERGAFTGANKEGKQGLFELANHGTLFLDEISEMPTNMQVKLLRILQEGTLNRLGSTKLIQVDVRIIAASNRDLEEEMKYGRFREDLYYRLNVVPIHIPALRERTDDVLPLTMFFINRYNKKYMKNKILDADVIHRLMEYRWPGNIRELQNVIERLVVLSDKDVITVSDLPVYILANDNDSGIMINRIMPLKEAVSSVEQQLISLAMEKYITTTRVAEALGVDQSTISRKIKNM